MSKLPWDELVPTLSINPEMAQMEDIAKMASELMTRNAQVDALLDHCKDGECPECAKIICPFKDDMHFHHDGCPSCHWEDGSKPMKEQPAKE